MISMLAFFENSAVLPDLGKLPHFGKILTMAGDKKLSPKNYGMG